MKKIYLTLSLLAALSLTACGGAAETAKDSKTATTDAKPATADIQPAAAEKPMDPAKPTDGMIKLGVAECDEYLEKVEKCGGSKNLPEAAKASLRESVAANRDAWKKLAANPATKKTLASVCQTALEQTKATFALCK